MEFSDKNKVTLIIKESIVESKLFNSVLEKAAIIDFLPKEPTFLFFLDRDSVVSPRNSLNYIENHKLKDNYVSFLNAEF